MYCFDTSIAVEYLRGNKEIVEKLNDLFGIDIFITPITLCELYKGGYLDKNPEFKVIVINNFISCFYLLDFSKEVCITYGKEYARLKKLGKLIPDFDLIIACFVKVNNLILITKDKKHFKDMDIKLEIW